MDRLSPELEREGGSPPAAPAGPRGRVIAEAFRGSLGWGVTGAVFGALIGWERGGLPLGIAVGGAVLAMVGWVLGTTVGIADQWPLSRFLIRVLGGTFLGALYGVWLLRDVAVPKERKDLVAMLWTLVGALLGASTSVKFVKPRAVGKRSERRGE